MHRDRHCYYTNIVGGRRPATDDMVPREQVQMAQAELARATKVAQALTQVAQTEQQQTKSQTDTIGTLLCIIGLLVITTILMAVHSLDQTSELRHLSDLLNKTQAWHLPMLTSLTNIQTPLSPTSELMTSLAELETWHVMQHEDKYNKEMEGAMFYDDQQMAYYRFQGHGYRVVWHEPLSWWSAVHAARNQTLSKGGDGGRSGGGDGGRGGGDGGRGCAGGGGSRGCAGGGGGGSRGCSSNSGIGNHYGGGSLAVVESQAEHQFINDLIAHEIRHQLHGHRHQVEVMTAVRTQWEREGRVRIWLGAVAQPTWSSPADTRTVQWQWVSKQHFTLADTRTHTLPRLVETSNTDTAWGWWPDAQRLTLADHDMNMNVDMDMAHCMVLESRDPNLLSRINKRLTATHKPSFNTTITSFSSRDQLRWNGVACQTERPYVIEWSYE